ncbi:MAG: hypothetical protein DHS20C14_22760 [Phycisphaeraceae bacterium]|nr:MAG: hypothetical protein DHS20C14_22760 [Phycisphaeraceae bacterium]
MLGAPRDKTRVIHLAPRWSRPATPPAPVPGVPERYLVHLGTIEPRKNVAVLLDALASMPESERPTLLLVGRPGWGPPAFWESLTSHPMAEYVCHTGYVTDAQARALVAGASGLVCPSVYEGFGLPALEAMALGVPVAASTAPSLVEVVADAAPTLDPHDANAWADAMRAMINHGAQRDAHIERGIARAAEFSWSKASAEHERVLYETAQRDT